MPGLYDALARQITRISVESEYLPRIDIDKPFEPGPPNPFLSALRPKITVELNGDSANPITIAPYGEPTGSGAAKIEWGVWAIAAAAGFWLSRKARQKKVRAA